MIEISIVIIVFIVAATIVLVKWLDQRCKHEWEIIEKVVVDTHGANDFDRLYLRCKKCGECKCQTMR